MRLADFALSALDADDPDSAIDAAELALARDDEDPQAHAAMGFALARRGLFSRAAHHLARAGDADLAVWCALAECAFAVNDYPAMVRALRECVRLDPEARTPHGVRARVIAVRARGAIVAAEPAVR